MRLVGGDAYGQLNAVTDALEARGLPRLAKATRLMYAGMDESQRLTGQLELLESQLKRCQNNPDFDPEILISTPAVKKPRLSLIVSLYNAANKLDFFLSKLFEQTLALKAQMQIVLVDSHSPTNELTIYNSRKADTACPMVYLRTRERESIQQAWNRGLSLASADNVAFWGVDEGGTPDCLERLVDVLDARPDVNWVQASGQVLEVDGQGKPTRETYRYLRTDYATGDLHLDHQRITFVGGAYRKALHEKAGYYDTDFRAAGDTEFKYRVQPWLRVQIIPDILGLYYNYPEARATENPISEVEDTFAFDLHHSRGGIQYGYGQLNPQELLEISKRALCFQTTTYPHLWSDLQTGVLIAQLRREKPGADNDVPDCKSLERLFSKYQRLDRRSGLGQLLSATWSGYRLLRSCWRQSGHQYQPACWIFNDIRYARYITPWK